MDAGKPSRPAPCRRCGFLRIYLVLAGGIILLMALRPEAVQRLGPILPTPEAISATLTAAAATLALIRWIRWKRRPQPAAAPRQSVPAAR
ncbi:hypothetical protein SAMN05878503_101431 [Cereibacter ovatus]|uniref:Uncharacterized protein n=1 Tax=Cereibacter ovatus TaxID=439529 RepID=A0A285CLA2_9RHOB|nr:hypothetical protein SAMN05878503_101431 [Cereibacter ovatus]